MNDTGSLVLNSSKKYGPRVSNAVSPDYTQFLLVTAMKTIRLNTNFLVSKFGNSGYSLNRPNESDLPLTKEYSIAILD